MFEKHLYLYKCNTGFKHLKWIIAVNSIYWTRLMITKASETISKIFVNKKVAHMWLMRVYDSLLLDKQCN